MYRTMQLSHLSLCLCIAGIFVLCLRSLHRNHCFRYLHAAHDQHALGFHAGQQLDGLQYLMSYCTLHDDAVVQHVLEDDQALPSLEDSWASADSSTTALSVLPDIVRVMNSKVSELVCTVDALECLTALSHPAALQQVLQTHVSLGEDDAPEDSDQVRRAGICNALVQCDHETKSTSTRLHCHHKLYVQQQTTCRITLTNGM